MAVIETRLWLARHAEPEDSASGRCYGKLDLALSAAGLEQASRLARHLRDEPLAAVYASPRRRTVQTAEALGRTVHLAGDLREIDFGAFEGRTYEEIERDYPDVFARWMSQPTEVHFPGGESFSQMRRRVLRAAGEIRKRHAGETVAIVAHGGTLRILLAEALGIPDANIFRLGQPYCALSLIRYAGDYPIVEAMNATLMV